MTATRSWLPWLGLVAFITLVRGVLLAGLIPPMNIADEPAHFDYAQRLGEDLRLPSREPGCTGYSAENRALTTSLNDPIKFRPSRPMPPLSAFVAPDPDDRASRATQGCGAAAAYPPLYYATAAAAYRIERGAPFLQRFFAARLASVGWGMLTACFAFLLGVVWSGAPRDGALLGMIVSAQPMIAHFAAAVNSDAAVTACAAGAFVAVAMLARGGNHRHAFLLLVATTVAGGLCKPLFAFILPILAIGVVIALGPRRLGSWLRAAALLAPATVTILVWSIHVRASDKLLPMNREPYLAIAARTLAPDRLYVIWHKTFWMCWGWLDTWINEDYYSALALAVVLAAAGVALGWRRFDERQRALAWLAAGGTGFMLVEMHLLELLVVRSTGSPLVQGRYLLPLFPLQALAIVIGLRALSRRLGSWMDGAWLLAASLLVVDAASIARALVRYYA